MVWILISSVLFFYTMVCPTRAETLAESFVIRVKDLTTLVTEQKEIIENLTDLVEEQKNMMDGYRTELTELRVQLNSSLFNFYPGFECK